MEKMMFIPVCVESKHGDVYGNKHNPFMPMTTMMVGW
jgi:hypothetical protein